MMKFLIFIAVLAIAVQYTAADTPANCTFMDAEGDWIFYESDRLYDNKISCNGSGKLKIVIK